MYWVFCWYAPVIISHFAFIASGYMLLKLANTGAATLDSEICLTSFKLVITGTGINARAKEETETNSRAAKIIFFILKFLQVEIKNSSNNKPDHNQKGCR